MSRATPDDVRGITGSEEPDEVIQPYLDTAHILVNRVIACAGNPDEETLTHAEAYLAAHLMTVTGGGGGAENASVTSESIDGHSITYGVSSANGDGVMSTHYGQVADTLLNGCLQKMQRMKAKIFFSGGA